MKYESGEIIIAKTSHKECGYVRGDTLKIQYESCFKGDYVAKNLTRPNMDGRNGRAYLGSSIFRVKRVNGKPASDDSMYEITFLGIPLLSVKKVKQ
jgi:hypothetical protein